MSAYYPLFTVTAVGCTDKQREKHKTLRKSKLLQELLSFGNQFYLYCCMSCHNYNCLLVIIKEDICKDKTNFISAKD